MQKILDFFEADRRSLSEAFWSLYFYRRMLLILFFVVLNGLLPMFVENPYVLYGFMVVAFVLSIIVIYLYGYVVLHIAMRDKENGIWRWLACFVVIANMIAEPFVLFAVILRADFDILFYYI